MKYLLTSESVTEGHPDKVCDQISDAVLDELMKQDKKSKVAVECLTTKGLVIVAGEVTTKGYVDVQKTARKILKDIGYNHPEYGFDFDSCAILTALHEQSPDIARGVDHKEQGAGDQGLMFGYATNETPEFMPLPITLAHKLTKRMAEVRKKGIVKWMRPDGKSQVTIEYEKGVPKRIDTIVISTQHSPDVSKKKIRQDVMEKVIKPICGKMIDKKTKYYINPTGRFVIGGPPGDTGLTGRKIIMDTYGGVGSHGGGCFSGKDPSKVDRSASYMARYIVKNIVAAGIADRCEIQISYAIGIAKPVSIMIRTFGTGIVPDEDIVKAVKKVFDMRPREIIRQLDLLKPVYLKTATYGHFGRKGFTWEKTDKIKELRKALNI